MKERPILFSGPMVRVILDGRKTQTRRVIKSSIVDFHKLEFMHLDHDSSPWCAWFEKGRVQEWVNCPYGKVGDRLWVLETWFDNLYPRTSADGLNEVYYRADGEAHQQFPGDYMDMRWTPSIHMPRWASRITLEITGVRVERLNEISETDAEAEGCSPAERVCDSCGWIGTWEELGDVQDGDDEDCHRCPKCGDDTDGWYLDEQFRKGFRGLWELINGKGSWAANPWVWVIEFKRIDA